ncbi:MAG: hypothetical protein ABSA41_12120 [Terriglobia bacterium]|jgi:hypothetical protein
MKGPKAGVLAFIGIAVGVLGIISPILWDRYKVSSALELQCVSFETLVERSAQLEKLIITYNGENLNQISKADFILVNTGRTPIVEKDLVSPPQITFARDTEVLDAKIEGLQPGNLGAKVDLDKARNAVIITFPLLNPDDYIRFGIFMDSKALNFDAKARIAGISGLSVTQKISRTNKVSRSVPWTVYPVGFFSALLFLATVGGAIPHSVREHKVKQSIKGNQFAIPKNGTQETCLSFVDRELSFTLPRERKPLIDMIKSFSTNPSLDSTQQKQVEERIHAIVRSATPNLPAALIILAMSLAGFWYILAKIW